MYRISFKLQRRFTIAMKTWLALMLLTKTTFKAAMAECPALDSNSSRLGSRSGTLRYTDHSQSKTDTWCGWSFPASKLADHVILVKIVSLSMFRGTCMGLLSLPRFKPFCHMPVNACFAFAPRNSCYRQATFDFVKNKGCTSIFWSFDEHDSLRIRYRSRGVGRKTFSFMYKMISCRQGLEITAENHTTQPMSQTRPRILATASDKADVFTDGSDTVRSMSSFHHRVFPTSEAEGLFLTRNDPTRIKSQIYSGMPPVTFIAVVVSLVLMLLTCFILLFVLYRRNVQLRAKVKGQVVSTESNDDRASPTYERIRERKVEEAQTVAVEENPGYEIPSDVTPQAVRLEERPGYESVNYRTSHLYDRPALN